jgi:hypothetical protein
VASHYGSFETVRRVRDGAVLWLATCGCGRVWAEPAYSAAEAKWRKHATDGDEVQEMVQPYCDKPEDCPNGPDWHEFVPPGPDAGVCPCARQDWEKETPQ